jgi:uncharacterized protein
MKVELVVVDTNVLISARLVAGSAPAQVLERLRDQGAQLLFSPATFAELDSRMRKDKFRRYVSAKAVDLFLQGLVNVSVLREPTLPVTACRDADDNKFLALALEGEADCIITGDQDLLVLHPFEHIPILSPQTFLKDE